MEAAQGCAGIFGMSRAQLLRAPVIAAFTVTGEGGG